MSKNLLICSAGHKMNGDITGMGPGLTGFKRSGDRCGQLISFDTLAGSRYCRCVLKSSPTTKPRRGRPPGSPNKQTKLKARRLQVVLNGPEGEWFEAFKAKHGLSDPKAFRLMCREHYNKRYQNELQ